VRTLFGAVSGSDWEHAVQDIRLCGLDEAGWTTEETPSPIFVFAVGVYGDAIGCDESGRVLLADHESDEGTAVLETGLSAWLDRLTEYGGMEYAYFMGSIGELPADAQRRFLRRHRELNPGSEWAARGLLRLDYPEGHPLGYHHWDRATGRLAPIGEAGEVKHVTLDHPRERDLESVARAGVCEHLMIVGGEITNLSVLAKLRGLRELYVYDVPEVDAAELVGVRSLVDVCFLRCHVRRLEELGRLPALQRLRLNECTFDEDALRVVRRMRSGIRLS
jgi:hypothetical protein